MSTAKRRRTRTAHSGVELKSRQRATGTVWLARWKNPTSGQAVEVSLTALGLTSTEKRLGHSVVVSERHYAGLLLDLPKTATSIEAAIGIEDLAAAIVTRASGNQDRQAVTGT